MPKTQDALAARQNVLQMHSMQGDIEGHCVKLERCSLSYDRYLKTPEVWGSSKER